MKRYLVEIQYKGTAYHGWQIQPSGITVQEVLDKCLTMILNEKITTTGAGRTDAGVHAKKMYAHFDLDKEINDTSKLVYALNKMLPPDIKIGDINPTDSEFHARFSAKKRTYKYFITLEKNPFLFDYTAYFGPSLDIAKMQDASKKMLEYDDFTSFCKLHADNKTNICHLTEASWDVDQEKKLLVFTISADRFLRNMVRAIVGTLINVGRNKISIEEFSEIIEKRDRGAAGESVPAKGLFLWNVEY